MGLLSKALKTAAKAATTAKDASRTKPKSQINPLVKPRNQERLDVSKRKVDQSVKDALRKKALSEVVGNPQADQARMQLQLIEDYEPKKTFGKEGLGEFYSPVINTLKEMSISKQGTKGENISAFLNKRAPNIESSERKSFDLALDPQRMYTKEEVIDIAKGKGSEEYTISKVDDKNFRNEQRQKVKDKEEEYFVLTVDSTRPIDAAGTKVHFGNPKTNLGHTRSSIRRETPAGGPLTKKIKDRDRYILIEELQSDISADYTKQKKTSKKGKAPVNPAGRKITDIVFDSLEEGFENLEFNSYESFSLVDEGIELAIERAYVKKFTENIDSVTAGKELAELLEKNYGVKTVGKKDINSVSQNAIKNNLVNENGVRYDGNDVDVDDTINNMFSEMETDFETEMVAQKEFERQQKGLAINPPIETRSDYVKKLILANINYAKRNNINKIVVPDYREIARQRINTFDYAMDQADADSPTKIKFQNLYKDLEDKKITQRVYNKKYNEMSKEYFENLFKKTYQDALKKVLNNLKTETKGAIKIGTRKLEYPAAGNFKGRTSTATEIDITDFNFDPETQALRFNMGGVVPPKNYAEGGVVSMNNQTQQAFALGGLKDEGGEIDEASGNRVPIGGTKEGVRDDIPANVSEGEFIFPADVVRYHGLDKMMALRQEAKMGLKQMERMGQMGNSEEATMPDDLPFGMADLIVVGGEGEPMEFADGGFVPQMQTLQTAPVPTMGGSTSTGTQTPIVYDDFMKTPVVTMQEYRDANGNSIIITSVNGKATTEIPAGYTLYTPPANTAPTTTQAAIQTVNRRSYRPTTGDNEGPEPQPDQPAPDYRNMNDDEFFSYMAEQNGFGAKAGNAAGLAIATMVGGPVGLLVGALMRNNKNNQMANMKSRIDRMDNGPAKTNALALYKEYGGETDPKKKEGLFANITNFVTGLVTPVANALGINQEDAAKVAQNAAVTEVSGAAAYDEKVKQARANIISPAQSVTPTADQTRPQLRPDQFPTVQETISKYPKGNVVPDQIASPLGSVLSTEANQGMVPAPASTSVAARSPTDFQYDAQNKALISGRIADQNFTNDRNAFIKATDQAKQIEQNAAQMRADTLREQSLTMPGGIDPSQSVSKSKIKAGKPVGAAPRYDEDIPYVTQPAPAIERPVTQTDAALRSQTDAGALDDMIAGAPVRTSAFDTSRPAVQVAKGQRTNRVKDGSFGQIFDSITGQRSVEELRDQGKIAAQGILEEQALKESPDMFGPVAQPSAVTQQPPAVIQQAPVADFATPMDTPTYGTSLKRSPTDFQYAELDPRDTVNLTGTGVDAQMTAAIPPQQGLISKQMEGMGSPLSPVTSPIGLNVEPRARSMYEYPVQETAPKETAAQARAREAAAQRARIQTRNKEIAAATSKIPAYIANSKQTQDSIKAGYVGSTTGGYAIGKISGSDGNDAGVVQNADGKVTKLKDLEGYGGLKGTQRGNMTVFSDAEGTKFVKSTFGKKTKLNGDKYEGPGITRKDKGLGNTFFQSAANVLTPGDGKSYVDGELVNDSGSSKSSSTKTYNSLAEAAKDGQHGQSVNIAGKGVQKVAFGDASYDAKMKAESDKADDGGSDDSKIVCTEMYRQTQLVDWQHTMKIWHVYQEKYLTPYHQIGYHWLFKPYVKGMKKSSILTKLGATLAKHRTEHLRYVLTKGKSKDNLVGNVWCKFVHPLVYVAGIFKQKIGK